MMTISQAQVDTYLGIWLAVWALAALLWRFRQPLRPRVPTEPVARTLLLAGGAALLPWLIARVVLGADDYSSPWSYVEAAILPIFGAGGWYHRPEWYDHLASAGLALVGAAMYWRAAVLPVWQRIIGWVTQHKADQSGK